MNEYNVTDTAMTIQRLRILLAKLQEADKECNKGWAHLSEVKATEK